MNNKINLQDRIDVNERDMLPCVPVPGVTVDDVKNSYVRPLS